MHDLAVAMLLNTGTPDGAQIIDRVLALMLPQYRDTVPAGVVRWSMAGSLGVEGEPFDLAMRLHVRGAVLARIGGRVRLRRLGTGIPVQNDLVVAGQAGGVHDRPVQLAGEARDQPFHGAVFAQAGVDYGALPLTAMAP